MKLDAMAMGLPLREAQRLAADIEEAGFSGLWFTEGGPHRLPRRHRGGTGHLRAWTSAPASPWPSPAAR